MPSTQPSWISATLQNSWYNNNTSAFYPAEYRKWDCGRVEVHGILRKTNAASQDEVIFNLPSGYRPSKRIIQLISSYADGNNVYSSVGRVDILTNGDIIFVFGYTDANRVGGSGTSYLSLDGISFYV